VEEHSPWRLRQTMALLELGLQRSTRQQRRLTPSHQQRVNVQAQLQ
jgi:hypothetical protein